MNTSALQEIELLTVSDVVAKFKIKKSTVYKLCSKGKLPAVKIGGSTRFRASTLLSWMQEQEKSNYGRTL